MSPEAKEIPGGRIMQNQLITAADYAHYELTKMRVVFGQVCNEQTWVVCLEVIDAMTETLLGYHLVLTADNKELAVQAGHVVNDSLKRNALKFN